MTAMRDVKRRAALAAGAGGLVAWAEESGRGTGAKRVAVRVLRAGVDRVLAGPGDVAGAAADPDRDGRPGTGLLPSLGGTCRVGGQYAMFAASSRACSDSEDRAAISAALRVAL
jgi:hypothetical protein